MSFAQHILDYTIPLDVAIKKNGLEDKVDFTIIFSAGVYNLISKKTLNAKEIMKKIDEATIEVLKTPLKF